MLCLRASAKLNLYLRVLGRRADGYHEIETLFERIDLADELTFVPHPTECLLEVTDVSSGGPPHLSAGPDNLVLKAAKLLRTETGTAQGARIHLLKRIPVAAGLGGGSSDAATTLVGLTRLWGLSIERSTLFQFAATLGSDVPVFLQDEPVAIGRGRGERCEPISAPVSLAHVVVVPNARLLTKEVYASLRVNLTAPRPSITMAQRALSNGSLSELAAGLWNDLEPEAIRRCPSIAALRVRLHALGCLGVCVSGSGPSLFGLCTTVDQANTIATTLRQHVDPSVRVLVAEMEHRVALPHLTC